MLSFVVLLLSVAMLVVQLTADKRATVLSPHILFQLYFIIQLPLNLFLGTNFYLPRFDALSPLTSSIDVLRLGFLILIAQAIFVATVYIMASRPAPASLAIQAWPRGRVTLVCASIILLAYAAFLGLVFINGGFAAFAEAREVWRTSGVGGQGWVLFPATTLPAIAMCAIMVTHREQFAGRIGAIKLSLLYMIVVFPASQLGFRGLIFLPLLQVSYFYHSFVRPISGRYVALGSIGLLIAFTLYGTQREVPYRESYGSYLEYLNYIYITRPDITYTVVLRSMGADIVQRTIDHVATFDDYMKIYPIVVEALTIPIPSSLWPDKPFPLSVQFSRNIFGIDGGVSPTIVGEGYWHGGVIGIIVLMMAAGALHGYFRSLQRQSHRKDSSAILMLSIYPSLIMMAEAFQGYFNGIILIVIANWLLRQTLGKSTAMSLSTSHGDVRQSSRLQSP